MLLFALSQYNTTLAFTQKEANKPVLDQGPVQPQQMGKPRKTEGRLEDEVVLQDDDYEDDYEGPDMNDFDSEKSWSAMDQLEEGLFKGEVDDIPASDEEAGGTSKMFRKRDRRKERELQIQQYEEALKIQQAKQLKFVDPFSNYSLNTTDMSHYQNVLNNVSDNKVLLHPGLVRFMGIKSVRKLKEDRLYQELLLIKYFVNNNKKVPDSIVEAHKFLLTSQGDTLYRQQAAQPSSAGETKPSGQ